MIIIETREYKNPYRIKRTLIFNSDSYLKQRGRDIYQRIDDLNEAIDKGIDKITGRIINLFG